MNGKHDAVAETIIAPPLLVHDHQPGFAQRLRLIVGEHRFQVLPAVGGVAETVAGGDFAAEPATLQIRHRPFRGLELGLVVLRRIEHDLGQIFGGLGLFLMAQVGGLLGHGHAGTTGQFLDRVDEAHALVLHQKADRGAVRAAAEAVIELLDRAHRERWGFLAVEGAAGGIV